jgi:poly-beta-1,6-N-acetyl-D-glucosamine biosynthesis protein PgaD
MITRPLIIDRPDLISPTRRALSIWLTIVAWLLWLVAWMPVLNDALGVIGFHLFTAKTDWKSLITYLPFAARFVPAAVLIFVLILIACYAWDTFGRTNRFPEDRARPVGIDRLAALASAPEASLLAWQTQKTLYVEHGDHGEILHVLPTRPSDASM